MNEDDFESEESDFFLGTADSDEIEGNDTERIEGERGDY